MKAFRHNSPLQLYTGHQIKPSEADVFLCDRALVQLNTQLIITWLQIVS